MERSIRDDKGTPDVGQTRTVLSPDEVIHLLETCDLSEQDTEVLLKDAYALNRRLKEKLASVSSGASRSAPLPLKGKERCNYTLQNSLICGSIVGRPSAAQSVAQVTQPLFPSIASSSARQHRLHKIGQAYRSTSAAKSLKSSSAGRTSAIVETAATKRVQ